MSDPRHSPDPAGPPTSAPRHGGPTSPLASPPVMADRRLAPPGGQPTWGPPAWGPGAPPPAWAAAGSAGQRARPAGPILMLLGLIGCVVGVFLPWNYDLVMVDTPAGGYEFQKGDVYNGLDQMMVNLDNGRFYGTLMLIAFLVALIACIGTLVAAVGTLAARPEGSGLGVIALISAILGLIATVGTILGYFALDASDEMYFGVWIFGLSFIPVLIGSIGVLAKRY